jgi:hypothetical protein
MEMVVGFLVIACVPAYWILQIAMARNYMGGWRIAVLVPLVAMVPVVGFTVFALAIGANLWPLPLILASPVAAGYLVAVALARIVLARE